MTYTLCAHCDHFVDEEGGGYIHLCDEVDHNPDDDHAAEPGGKAHTLEEWHRLRPELFATHPDGLIGPNSAFHSPKRFNSHAET